jgi:Zn-dependent metalloprotease
MRFLYFLLIIEIGMSPLAFAELKNQSTPNCFMGMEMTLPQDAIIKSDKISKTIVFLKGNNLSADLENDENFKVLQSKKNYPQIALAFLCANHALFHLVAPADELSVKSIETDELGFTHVKFQQSYKGIPVWASEINLHLNPQNQVCLVQGRYIPTPENVNLQPVLTEKDAMGIVAEKLGKDRSVCPGCRCEIIIFADTNVTPCLSYRIEATLSLTEGWEFFMDANSGTVLNKIPTVFNGKSQSGRIKMGPQK